MAHKGKSVVRSLLLILLALSLTGQGARAAEPPLPGPPQFVSPPIHAPEQIQQLIGGWLTFAAAQRPGGGGGGGGGTTGATTTFSLSAQTLATGFPVDVVNRLDSYQGETAVAAISGGWIGGFNSIVPGQCNAGLANCAPGATVSTDGTTWSTSSIPIVGNLLGFDPSVAVDGAGTIYYGYGVCSGGCGTANVMVATSTTGTTWTTHTVTPPQGGIFDDKYWVAADPNPARAGRAYIAWDRNQGNNQLLMVSATSDSGQTWSRPVKINDGTSRFERVIYAMPAVDPNDGAVYVVWMDYARKALFVDRSSDFGTTWRTDVKVASLNVTFVDIGCNGGRSMTPAPYIAVDGSGRVYVTYADQKGTTGMDVYLVYSSDQGQTWSAPARLNNVATGHQYNPAMDVTPSGIVHVSWLDRRNDPNNCLTDTYSTYGSIVNGTATFAANVRVTAASSDFDGNPNGPGDYTGIVAWDVNATTTAALPLYPTHFAADISAETGTAGGFEAYAAVLQP